MMGVSIQVCFLFSPFLCRYDNHHREVRIVLVGKYTKSQDSYLSLIKSLKHAALACRHKLTLLVSVVPVNYTKYYY